MHAISSFLPPADCQQLQRFLGTINFYRRFVKNAAKILALLTNGLKGPASSFLRTPAINMAFLSAKNSLPPSPWWLMPSPRTLELLCNSWSTGLGSPLLFSFRSFLVLRPDILHSKESYLAPILLSASSDLLLKAGSFVCWQITNLCVPVSAMEWPTTTTSFLFGRVYRWHQMSGWGAKPCGWLFERPSPAPLTPAQSPPSSVAALFVDYKVVPSEQLKCAAFIHLRYIAANTNFTMFFYCVCFLFIYIHVLLLCVFPIFLILMFSYCVCVLVSLYWYSPIVCVS